MSRVLFISDLHLDHKNILNFAGDYRQGSTVAEHDDWIIDTINSVVGPRDTLYFLGDVAFSLAGLWRVDEIRCKHKHLIMGNHDQEVMSAYLDIFDTVRAYHKYKGYWLSHIPVHQHDFDYRVQGNIHGHLHHRRIGNGPDWYRYYNVSVEQSAGKPVPFDSIHAAMQSRIEAHVDVS